MMTDFSGRPGTSSNISPTNCSGERASRLLSCKQKKYKVKTLIRLRISLPCFSVKHLNMYLRSKTVEGAVSCSVDTSVHKHKPKKVLLSFASQVCCRCLMGKQDAFLMNTVIVLQCECIFDSACTGLNCVLSEISRFRGTRAENWPKLRMSH